MKAEVCPNAGSRNGVARRRVNIERQSDSRGKRDSEGQERNALSPCVAIAALATIADKACGTPQRILRNTSQLESAVRRDLRYHGEQSQSIQIGTAGQEGPGRPDDKASPAASGGNALPESRARHQRRRLLRARRRKDGSELGGAAWSSELYRNHLKRNADGVV
jgi:hypothetical protein